MSIFRMLRVSQEIAEPPVPPQGPSGASTSYQTGTAPSGGPLPTEVQIFIRVMGEDEEAALDLLRGLSVQDREIFGFWLARCMELIYRVAG